MEFVPKELRKFINWSDFFQGRSGIAVSELKEYLQDIDRGEQRHILSTFMFSPEEFIEMFSILTDLRIIDIVVVRQDWFTKIPRDLELFFRLNNYFPRAIPLIFSDDSIRKREIEINPNNVFKKETFLNNQFSIARIRAIFTIDDHSRYSLTLEIGMYHDGTFNIRDVDFLICLTSREGERNWASNPEDIDIILNKSDDSLKDLIIAGIKATEYNYEKTFEEIIEEGLKAEVVSLFSRSLNYSKELKLFLEKFPIKTSNDEACSG